MNKFNHSPSLLAKVCFRRLRLTGSVYLQAPGETVKEFMDKLAALRGLPPRVEGKCLPVQACDAARQQNQNGAVP